ncbi:hypothetical protein KM043_007824 [Ampulex compressa]|nr:hypothetical protein KM043_007824 [Ampulex compressa]
MERDRDIKKQKHSETKIEKDRDADGERQVDSLRSRPLAGLVRGYAPLFHYFEERRQGGGWWEDAAEKAWEEEKYVSAEVLSRGTSA